MLTLNGRVFEAEGGLDIGGATCNQPHVTSHARATGPTFSDTRRRYHSPSTEVEISTQLLSLITFHDSRLQPTPTDPVTAWRP